MKLVDCFPRADSIYCHHDVVEDRFLNNTIYVDAMHALCNTSLCHYRDNSLTGTACTQYNVYQCSCGVTMTHI